MTAFEILLNKFYETIEQNEPKNLSTSQRHRPGELNQLIKKFINTSFFHGHNLKYKSKISAMIDESTGLLQNSNYDDWAKVKFTFKENDLHIIRRDRCKNDVANLKMKLDRTF